MAKVLIINGSPRVGGNTSIALNEMVKVFEAEGVEAEVVQIGNKDIRGCIACASCKKNGKCVFDDVVNELAPKFEEADGLVHLWRGQADAFGVRKGLPHVGEELFKLGIVGCDGLGNSFQRRVTVCNYW